VQVRRFLRGCHVEAFAGDQAHEVGALLGRARTADVVDAHLVLTAAGSSSTIWTSDPADLRHLIAQLPVRVDIRRI
jgi:hypothetical protein